MRHETRTAGGQNHKDIEGGRGIPKDANGEKRSADWSDNGVHRIPRGVDPGNFVGKKFEKIEDAGDDDDGRMPERFERLVLRRERDPMLVHGQAGDEDREVKIDSREGGEPERHPEEVELFHGGNMRSTAGLSRALPKFFQLAEEVFEDWF